MNQSVTVGRIEQLTQDQRGTGPVTIPSNALVHAAPEVGDMFTTIAAFEASQRMAVALSKCDLLPKQYQNNAANCMVLISIAHRFRHMGIDPFMVAQQLVAVNGKYGWQGQFVMALVNGSRRFLQDLEYVFDGEGDDYGCTAVTKTKDGLKEIRGTKITWKMVKAEGWFGKSGSKWQTMPEQMFRYRAAAFFGRAYTPDLLMGFHTADELEDVGMKDVTPGVDKGANLTEMVMGAVPEEPEVLKKVARETAGSQEVRGKYSSDFGKLRLDSLVDDVEKDMSHH